MPLSDSQLNILRTNLGIRGAEHQLLKLVEEMSELTQVIAKIKLNGSIENLRNLQAKLVDETADVYIVLTAVIMSFSREDNIEFLQNIEFKVKRLEHRIRDLEVDPEKRDDLV